MQASILVLAPSQAHHSPAVANLRAAGHLLTLVSTPIAALHEARRLLPDLIVFVVPDQPDDLTWIEDILHCQPSTAGIPVLRLDAPVQPSLARRRPPLNQTQPIVPAAQFVQYVGRVLGESQQRLAAHTPEL